MEKFTMAQSPGIIKNFIYLKQEIPYLGNRDMIIEKFISLYFLFYAICMTILLALIVSIDCLII